MRLRPAASMRALLERRAERATESDLVRSALVVAPHPDDETLGCGGTIARKRRLGADVTIVVMTDGSRSHAARMPADQIAQARRGEVLAAGRTLGVPDDCVRLLAYPDGELDRHREGATEHLAALLQDRRPNEIYVPCRLDHPSDHVASYEIALAALRDYPLSITILEYPVWFWYHWPWVSLTVSMRRADLRVLANTARNGIGLRALRELHWGVPIDEVLDIKRAALAAHRSQTSRLNGDPGWLTLDDVSDGEFAACFLRPLELFRRSIAGQLR